MNVIIINNIKYVALMKKAMVPLPPTFRLGKNKN